MSHVDDLINVGDKLHSDRGTLLSLWQEIADNFYPERADFTITRYLGEEFADHLFSSYPLIARRELGNSFATMLRPKDKVWAHTTVEDPDSLSHAARVWLERADKIQRRVMYDRKSQFVRATKEGDQDFATFGQCVIHRETDWARPGLLYRSYHLRDVAWTEGIDGQINQIHRNWKPTVQDLLDKFDKKPNASLHSSVLRRKNGVDRFKTIPCRAAVMPSELFDSGKKHQGPWVHVYLDLENKHIIEEVGLVSHGYTIPRWTTVSGSQYGFSPAVTAGLADARLIQSMTLTLLEAGELATRPPMIATAEVVRSDIQLYAGGITWVESEYDERLGEALRPLTQDLRGIPFGMEAQAEVREMLATAFYLNKISMPLRSKEMTAYEASKMWEQYIRDAIPLFEPMETDYNGALMEDTFSELMRLGTFGPIEEVPEDLIDQDITFRFESPLHDAIERMDAETFIESTELISAAIELDENAGAVLDVVKTLRGALKGIGQKEENLRSEEDFEAIAAERVEAREVAEALALAQQGADVAKTANES